MIHSEFHNFALTISNWALKSVNREEKLFSAVQWKRVHSLKEAAERLRSDVPFRLKSNQNLYASASVDNHCD